MKNQDLFNITLTAADTKASEQIKVGFLLIQNMGYGKREIANEITDLRQAVGVMRAGMTDRQTDQLEHARLERTGVEYAEQGTIAEEFAETVGDLIEALNEGDYTCSLKVETKDSEQFIILSENRGDYITQLKFETNGEYEIHGGSPESAIKYTEAEASQLIVELGRGYSMEPLPEPFNLRKTVSSCGPILRGNLILTLNRGEFRIEAGVDKSWFQVISNDSACDTFQREGDSAEFSEESSHGVTDDWTEEDFQIIKNELNA
jgi:hypothetical protein